MRYKLYCYLGFWCLSRFLVLGHAPNRDATVPSVAILRIDPCTSYVGGVHIRATIIRRGPEDAVSTLPVCRTTVVAPGDRCRQEGLHAVWASANIVRGWVIGLDSCS